MSGGHYSLFGSLCGNMGNFRYLLLACGFLALAGSSNGGVLRDDCLFLVEQYFKSQHHEPEVHHEVAESVDFGHHGHATIEHGHDYHVMNPVIEEVVAPVEEHVMPEIECYYPPVMHTRPQATNIVVPAVSHEIEIPVVEKVVEEEYPHAHGHGHHQYVPQVLPLYHYVPKEHHEVIPETTSAANVLSWGNKHVTVGLVPESTPHRHLSVGVELPSTTAHVATSTIRPVTVTPHVTVAPHTSISHHAAVTPHAPAHTATAIVDTHHIGSSVVNVPPISGSMLCVFVPSDSSMDETCIPSSMIKQYISAHGHVAAHHEVTNHHNRFPHHLQRSPLSLFRH